LSQVTILLSISCPLSAYCCQRCCKDRPIQFIFLNPSVLWAPTVCTLSKTSNDHALCCTLIHGSTLAQLLHCLLLSFCRLESPLPHTLHSCFCHNLNMVTWSGIICDFKTSFREFLDPVVTCFEQQTLPTVNRKNLFMNILCTESFFPQECTTEHCTSVVHPSSSRYFDY
jgi:hypothetical protein